MTTQPSLTLSIVSHGDAEKVSHLLASIQQYETDTKRFQLILTDNLKDNLPAFDPAPWHSLHIVRNLRQQGFAKNHNRAFERAEGKYFAILNPDLIFEKPVFEKLTASLHAHRADLIAPAVVDANGIVQDSFRPLPTPLELVRRRIPGYQFQPPPPDPHGLVHPDWIAAMFWLMPSSVYQSLGGMDERYHLYFEDVDFCTRARLRGMRLLVDAQFRVRHDAQRSSRRSAYFLFLHTRSALRFFASSVYREARRKRSPSSEDTRLHE
ncbi:MAG: glycosyltransferase [Anaerolineales bacterium]|nr:glycosyltransferase [Anaerolineales bacterium]